MRLGDDIDSRLTLAIWHPDCWTLRVTERCSAGLLGHGAYAVDDALLGHFTAYADAEADVQRLLELVRESPLTDRVQAYDPQGAADAQLPAPGLATSGLLVTYDPDNSVQNALVGRGFIPDQPVRIDGGQEYWSVLTSGSNEEIQSRIAAIEAETGGEVTVRRIGPLETGTGSGVLRHDDLSTRQREVYEFARERGYYDWPRQASASDLAAAFGVSKATFLEHLRKAESKLLNPSG
jgi:predicted DNA binding protein